MAFAIDTTGVFADAALSKLQDDEILTKGSLLLVDMNHSKGGLGGATPSGSVQFNVPNIAYAQLAEAIGLTGSAASASALAAKFLSNLATTEAVFERTAMLGLHGAVSRTALQAGHTAYITGPDILTTYMRTRSRNRYFLSITGMVTRAALAGSGGLDSPLAGFASMNNAPANFFNLMTIGPTGINKGAELLNVIDPAQNVEAVPFYRAAASWRPSGTVPADDASCFVRFPVWGAPNPYGASITGSAPSFIFYRLYLEDLTVSGRLPWQVDAIERRIHRLSIGSGGKYYQDAYTPPSGLIA